MAKKKKDLYFDRETMQFVGIEPKLKEHMVATWRHLDIDYELGRMALWLVSPAGKTRTADLSFIMRWLDNAIIMSPKRPCESKDVALNLSDYDDYLKDLWKDREHILTMNQAKS